jgi:hypothetical protein
LNERLAPRANTPAWDDQQSRRLGLRLLLLPKGAVFANRFERSLTAEIDDTGQRRSRQQLTQGRCSFESERL